MKRMRRILSLVMALCLVPSLCLTVLADTWIWDLTQGSIEIGFQNDVQHVTQNSVSTPDANPTITSGGVETSNTISVKTEENQTAQFTIENVVIVTDQNTSGIDIANGSTVEMTVSGKNSVDMVQSGLPSDIGGKATVHVGNADLTIQGDGTLNINADPKINTKPNAENGERERGSSHGAGLGSNLNEDFTGTITIDGPVTMDVNNATGKQNSFGAGIGSGRNGDFDGTVNIMNGADVIGDSGANAAGIGAGESGDFNGKVSISDAKVVGTAYNNGAGIGGGYGGDFNGTLEIENSDVKARAGMSDVGGFGGNAAGIGGGYLGDFTGTVSIKNSTVDAAALNRGAGIGAGGNGGTGTQTAFSGTLIIDNSTVNASSVSTKTDRGIPIGSPTENGQFTSDAVVEITGNSKVNLLDSKNAQIGDTALIGANGTSEGSITIEDTSKVNVWSGTLDASKLTTDRDSYKQVAADSGSYGSVSMEEISTIANGAEVTVIIVPKASGSSAVAVDIFWLDVEDLILAAKKGDEIVIDMQDRIAMPVRILELAAEYGVTLTIKWNGGEDIVVTPDHSIDTDSAYILLEALVSLLNM